MAASLKILIIPLDWGLGHTTRCFPLVKHLQQNGHEVVMAAEGASAALIKANFPAVQLLEIRGYRISYSKNKKAFTAKIISQIPKILSAIRRERHWLKQQQAQYHFDLIISDNRYGLYHSSVPCVIMTHQLQIKSGKGPLIDGWLRKMHYRMLRRFTACWVVDEKEHGGYSGDLAHPDILPGNAKYIGILSQFMDRSLSSGNNEDHILVLLSGPEPMRGQLEATVMKQIAALKQYRFTVVAGNLSGKAINDLPEHITYYSHLPAAQLIHIIDKATLVICRSGYSTIMDMAVTGKKALLIPTPGQTEQEYLAQYLQQKNYFNTVAQQEMNLGKDIPLALAAKVHPEKIIHYRYKSELDRFVLEIGN